MDWSTFEQQVIGKAFHWNGRGPDRYDCWGLVLAGLRFAGIPMHDDWWMPDDPDSTQWIRIMEQETLKPRWQRVPIPAPGDVMALSTHRRIHHVALVVPVGVLQAVPGVGVIRSPLHALKGQGYQRVEAYRWA